MHKITKSIFSLYDSLIKKLYDSQKDLSINLIGVNIIDESCLDFIYHHGSLTPSEIAAKLNVTTSAVTQMLQKYEQLNLIEKKASLTDKRSIVVSLMPRVTKRFEDTYAELDRYMSNTLGCLSKSEQLELSRLLIKLVKQGDE
jgi:DNA-binding MarR family transcriptional regulator